MKLKASEAVFIAICLCAVAAAVFAVTLSRGRGGEAIKVNLAESEAEAYDVSVLNEATAEDFMHVRGIGEVKAQAIVEYRTAIGGFRRVSQLRDVSGISDATLALIIEHFYGNSAYISDVTKTDEPQSVPETESVKTELTAPEVTTVPPETAGEAPIATTSEKAMREVNINSATADEIADALLIDRKIAEEIVALREQIEYFSSVQELYLCDSFNDKIYQKVKNYIKMGE